MVRHPGQYVANINFTGMVHVALAKKKIRHLINNCIFFSVILLIENNNILLISEHHTLLVYMHLCSVFVFTYYVSHTMCNLIYFFISQ